ncbi:serine/arginine repetitive matrix protein 3-like [Choloepus didactylus]|uniref:serine/arginine repetitive matrix protein 3-like n=1 Tax=Choloepus didactylus TaxID=27675 RepID=UPI00189E0AEE|nr:serine/arginine repetitive matrix protein 3-like [Choloepus didactylus]
MLIASRVSVCVRTQPVCASLPLQLLQAVAAPPPSARSLPGPPEPSWGVLARVGPPGPQGPPVRLPSARATCVAASSPSPGGRNLGGTGPRKRRERRSQGQAGGPHRRRCRPRACPPPPPPPSAP